MRPLFRDRQDAGRQLAEQLAPRFAGRGDVVVLALPRGGVPVAFPIALALRATLDVLVVRKLGVPTNKEYAMGAIAGGGVVILDRHVVEALRISESAIQTVIKTEERELERRETRYRGGRPAASLRGRAVILVDDGLATGATMRAALAALKDSGPASIDVAVPVASDEAIELIRPEAQTVLCLATPFPFRAVGLWYEDFGQTSDEEVEQLLTRGHDHVR